MTSMRRLVFLTACVVGFFVPCPAFAQQGVKRTVLHQADLSGAPGMEIVSSIVETQPGASTYRHFHNGIEAGRVLEGGMVQYPGKEPQMMETGASIFNLRGVYHSGFKNVGDKPIKIYTVHVVDKGKPLYDGVEPPSGAKP